MYRLLIFDAATKKSNESQFMQEFFFDLLSSDFWAMNEMVKLIFDFFLNKQFILPLKFWTMQLDSSQFWVDSWISFEY